MKIEIEVHETAVRKPTLKESAGNCVIAWSRSERMWLFESVDDVIDAPTRFPLWFSMKGFPKPAPLRARKK